jgi:hypothetical protein
VLVIIFFEKKEKISFKPTSSKLLKVKLVYKALKSVKINQKNRDE